MRKRLLRWFAEWVTPEVTGRAPSTYAMAASVYPACGCTYETFDMPGSPRRYFHDPNCPFAVEPREEAS